MRPLDAFGYEIVDPGLSSDEMMRLAALLAQILETSILDLSGGVRGVFRRNPDAASDILCLPTLRSFVEEAIGQAAFAVSATLFTKVDGANWRVPWHQDLTIAVQARAPVEAYGPWSHKDGVTHVQPPARVLEGMLAVRIHLDACGENNGPLRVRPGTHLSGKLTAEQIDALATKVNDVPCCGSRGSMVALRPLLVHASSSSTAIAPRRVLHIEFSSTEIDAPLAWNERWSRGGKC